MTITAVARKLHAMIDAVINGNFMMRSEGTRCPGTA
jgi:hypothetical protein